MMSEKSIRSIYGKSLCGSCQIVKEALPDFEYKDFKALFDDYDADRASEIVTNSDGALPIIMIGNLQFKIVV